MSPCPFLATITITLRAPPHPLSIAESSSWKEIFLIAELRKFYQVSNSIAKSPIQREIFIVAEWRKFFQVFYHRIAMPQKLWMLKTRLLEFSSSRLFIKELSKKQIAEICLNSFFLNYNCCCCCSTENTTVVKTSIFKGLFWTCKIVLFFKIITNSIISLYPYLCFVYCFWPKSFSETTV